MRHAAAIGSLHAAGSDQAVRPGPSISIGEVGEAAGVDVDMLRRVLVAAGVTVADDDFRPADVATFQLFAYAAAIFGPEATLRFIRAMGSALAQIADAAIVDLSSSQVEDRLVKGDTDELARALATEDATAQLVELPTVMDGLFRLHVEQAIRRQRASG